MDAAGAHEPRPPPRLPAPALASVALAALAVYASALPNEFVWDDVHQVQSNPFVRSLERLPSAFTRSYWDASAAPGIDPTLYRPLTTASFVLSHALTGDSPAGFRAVNLLLHAASAVLVALLAAELGIAAAWSLVAGLAFALHPALSEAVVWIVGRAELAATAGVLAALLAWLRWLRTSRPALLALALLALLAGTGFKESAAAAVPLAAAIAFFLAPGGPWARARAAALRAAPLAVPVLLVALLRLALFGPPRPDDLGLFADVAGWRVALTMAKVVLAYLGLLLAPLRLRAHYDTADYLVAGPGIDPVAAGALALELALLGLAAWGVVRRRRAGLAGAWIACGLLPFLHLVPFPWLMAERFLYLPGAGFALLVACAGEALAAGPAAGQARRLPAAVAAAVLLLYAPRTVARTLDWRDEVVFFSRMVEQEPDLVIARRSLAMALARRGRGAEAAEQFRIMQELGWRPTERMAPDRWLRPRRPPGAP